MILSRWVLQSILTKRPRAISTWKVVTVGGEGISNAQELYGNLESAGYRVRFRTDHVAISTRTKTALLALVSVEQLGFKEGAPWKWIYRRARWCGYKLCPAEVALQLLLQHGSALKGGYYVGMRPVACSDIERDAPRTFAVVGPDGTKRSPLNGLLGLEFDPDYEWRPKDKWVFML